MNTVIIVNLNGNAFHMEEPGFHMLRAYLDRAQAQLTDNPDQTEIMSDLEQAIADKCTHFLNPHKNVLSATDIENVVQQMGPVQTDSAAPSPGPSSGERPSAANVPPSGPASRRLYQIREGAMISGVCTGIAAYLDIDVTIVRILFVLLALLTTGIWIVVYIVMMLVIPFANTHEEHAAAAGAPFNAQEVIDRAKKHYAEFKDSHEWRMHWRLQRREWRRKWRDNRYWWGHNLQRNVHQFSTGTGYAGQVVAGLMIPFLAIASTLVFCLLIAAIVVVTTTGSLLGWAVAGTMPLWVAVLLLLIVYSAIASPLRHARKGIYFNTSGYHFFWFAAWYELLSTAVFVAVCWFAYTHIPQVHDFFENFLENWQTMMHNVIESIRHSAAHAPAALEPIARLIRA
jgi:phage shock protein PspC (stress-responsive transcriptional regulator)